MEHLKLAIATIETQLDELRNEVKQLEEQPKPKVETAWYDFTEEQMERLGEIVNNFIDNLTSNMRNVDIDLCEGNVNVNITLDLQDLIEDALPYGMSDKFIDFLNDEITEQREEQQQDCKESN
jgi:flagellar biosynthesis chaperone FliJ